MGVAEERAVGGLAPERDPAERRLLKDAPVGGRQQPAKERGRGRQHGHAFLGQGTGYHIGIAGCRHDEPAAGEQRLQPHLNARPAGGVVGEEPGKPMPLLCQPSRRQQRIPGMLDELGRTARARGGHHDMGRDRLELEPRPTRGRGQLQRITNLDPVAKGTGKVAGIIGEKRHGHVLPSAGGRNHHERLDPLRPGHDAHGPSGVERGFEGCHLGGER